MNRKKSPSRSYRDIEKRKPTRFSHCELSGKIKNFLSTIIRQRIRLVEAGDSMKNEMLMRTLIEKYKPYRTYQFTNIGAATFLIRHNSDIRQLITERSKKTIAEFENLTAQAKEILSPKLF